MLPRATHTINKRKALAIFRCENVIKFKIRVQRHALIYNIPNSEWIWSHKFLFHSILLCEWHLRSFGTAFTPFTVHLAFGAATTCNINAIFAAQATNIQNRLHNLQTRFIIDDLFHFFFNYRRRCSIYVGIAMNWTSAFFTLYTNNKWQR